MSNVIKFPSNDNGSKEPPISNPKPLGSGFFFLDVEILEEGVFKYTVDVSTNNDEYVCNIIEGLLVQMANNLSPKVRVTDLDTGVDDV